MNKKKIIILSVILSLLAATTASIFYINNILLPKIVQEKIVSGLSGFTSGKVTLGNMRFNLLRGLVVSNITLYDKDDPSKILLYAKDVSAGFILPVLIREKRIVIPTLRLSSVEFNLLRLKDGTFNISYLKEKIGSINTGEKMPVLFIKTIKLYDGAIHFTDSFANPALSADLQLKRLIANVSLFKTMLDIEAMLNIDTSKIPLDLKADYTYASGLSTLDATVGAIDLLTFRQYLNNPPVLVESGKIDNIKIEAILDDKTLKSKTEFNFNALTISQKNFTLKNAKGKIQVGISAPKENLKSINYEGNASINAQEVSGLVQQAGKISDINAMLTFKNNEVLIDELLAKTLDTDFSCRGDLKGSLLNLDLEGDFDLEKLKTVLPNSLDLPSFEISGTAEAKIHIADDISNEDPPIFAGEALVKNAELNLPESKTLLEADIGRLRFDSVKESIEGHFETIKYNGTPYGLDAAMKGFKSPSINAMVIGSDIKIHADITNNENLLRLNKVKGSYKGADFDLSGTLDKSNNLNISGEAKLTLENLSALLPGIKDSIKTMDPKGTCVIQADASGPISNWQEWHINAKGSSNSVSIYGLALKNFRLDYAQTQKQGFINLVSFDAYQGKGALKGKIDFLKNDASYSLRGILNNIDLNAAKMDIPGLTDKAFSGILDSTISAKGLASNSDTLKGNGSISIKDGNLWDFNPLKGLGDFLFIPRFSHIVFTNAQGDFYIQNSYIATDNFELLGTELGLIAEGKITFKGDLDFIVNTQIAIPGTEKLDTVISKAGSLTAIKISGTVREPKYKLQPIGENIIKKFGEIFSGIMP